jgi:hypothetical protein
LWLGLAEDVLEAAFLVLEVATLRISLGHF